MKLETDINRFIEAQEIPYFCGYKQALEEIKNGKKINHWIWYIFPQLRCLGRSSRAHFYGIADKSEAEDSRFTNSGDYRSIVSSQKQNGIGDIWGNRCNKGTFLHDYVRLFISV